ncbi:hypothetical protein MMC25_003239 [Agyrium rufum]|nr:hypothetical protein [Agyrium rufum]
MKDILAVEYVVIDETNPMYVVRIEFGSNPFKKNRVFSALWTKGKGIQYLCNGRYPAWQFTSLFCDNSERSKPETPGRMLETTELLATDSSCNTETFAVFINIPSMIEATDLRIRLVLFPEGISSRSYPLTIGHFDPFDVLELLYDMQPKVPLGIWKHGRTASGLDDLREYFEPPDSYQPSQTHFNTRSNLDLAKRIDGTFLDQTREQWLDSLTTEARLAKAARKYKYRWPSPTEMSNYRPGTHMDSIMLHSAHNLQRFGCHMDQAVLPGHSIQYLGDCWVWAQSPDHIRGHPSDTWIDEKDEGDCDIYWVIVEEIPINRWETMLFLMSKFKVPGHCELCPKHEHRRHSKGMVYGVPHDWCLTCQWRTFLYDVAIQCAYLDLSTLKNLRLVSKALERIVSQEIFSSLDVPCNEAGFKRIDLIASHESLASCVQTLKIGDRSTASPTRLEAGQFKRFVNLRSLHLYYYPLLRVPHPTLLDMFGTSLSQLRRCHLRAVHITYDLLKELLQRRITDLCLDVVLGFSQPLRKFLKLLCKYPVTIDLRAILTDQKEYLIRLPDESYELLSEDGPQNFDNVSDWVDTSIKRAPLSTDWLSVYEKLMAELPL